MLVFIIRIQFRTIGCFKYRNIHIVPFIETNKKFPSICIYKIKRLLWNISKCANSSREQDKSSNSLFTSIILGISPYGFVTKGGPRTSRGTSAALERGAPTIETLSKFSEKKVHEIKENLVNAGEGCPSRSTICCDDYTSGRRCLCKRSKTMLIPEFAFDWTSNIHVILCSSQLFQAQLTRSFLHLCHCAQLGLILTLKKLKLTNRGTPC